MEVGILTFSRVHNYGAILQCYALYESLKNLGHNVKIIEYKQPFLEASSRPFIFKAFINKLTHPRSFLRYIKQYKSRVISEKQYNTFKSLYLDCTKPCDSKHIPPNFDLYIIGSDQVWGTNCTNGIDKVYLGFFKRKSNSKLASYAISSNLESINILGASLIQNSLANFNHLSFRESIISEKLSTFTKKRIDTHLAPTLIVDKETWMKISNNKYAHRRYVLIYEARLYNNDRNYLKRIANDYAKQYDYEVLDPLSCKCSPSDFVSLFKYAHHIITTSFHGTVFGLIFNKPMSVFCLNDGHDSRYVNLLNSIGASDFLNNIGEPIKVSNVNYEIVNKKLEELKNNSIEYLKSL